MLYTLGISVFVAALCLAAISDLRTRRIPNALTATAFVLALLIRATMGGGPLLNGVLGTGLALLLLFPLFAVGGVGGGDAKLLIVAGAFLGPSTFLVALFCTALTGGAMALIAAARNGTVLPAIFNTGGLLKYWISLGRQGEHISLASPGAITVPYAVAIGIGCTAALFMAGGI